MDDKVDMIKAQDQLQYDIAELLALVEQAKIFTSDTFMAMKEDKRTSDTYEIRLGKLDPTELEIDWKTLPSVHKMVKGTKTFSQNKMEKLQQELKNLHLKVKLSRSQFQLALAQLKPSAGGGNNKPMQSAAIEKSAPNQWKGQGDKRAISEFLDSVEHYVCVTKCVPAINQTRELARLALSLMNECAEGKRINENFKTWRKEQTSAEAWPEKGEISKWMTQSLTNPKTGAAIRAEFNSITQTKTGLEGLHSYAGKVRTELARLIEVDLEPDPFTTKLQFRNNLHNSIRSQIPDEIKDSVIEDKSISPLDFIDKVCEIAVGKLQGAGTTEHANQSGKGYHFANKKQFDDAVRLATSKKKTPLKGRKKIKGPKPKGRRVLIAKPGDRKRPVPKDWKEKMCTKCGALYHSADTCYHNDSMTKKRPMSFKVMSGEDLQTLKKQRQTMYEKEA